MDAYTAWHALTGEHDCAPAQEEREMPIEDFNMLDDDFDMEQEEKAAFARSLERRWDRAFFAALTGFCMNGERIVGIVDMAEGIANETIRGHADMMADRDKLIAEVVG